MVTLILKPIPLPPPFVQQIEEETQRGKILKVYFYDEGVVCEYHSYGSFGLNVGLCEVYEGLGDKKEDSEFQVSG